MQCDDFIMQNVDLGRDGYSPAEVAEIVEGAWNEALRSYHEFRQRSEMKPCVTPGHKILVGSEWVSASDLKVEDMEIVR